MPRGEHRPSILLSRDENEQVFALIGPKCLSLSSAVIQLFTTEGPGHSEWKKKDTGVLCLIKDSAKRSYFFRIYCLCRKAMIWEHEVYLEIEYKSPRPYLHTFEAEEYMTAFNFANEDEARSLRNILFEKIELRKQKREDRRQRSLLAAQGNRAPQPPAARHNGAQPPAARHNGAPPPAAPPPAPLPAHHALKPANSLSGNYASKGKKPKTRKLTKADIGSPQNFKHVSHVGLDPNKCFDVDIPEEDMRSFFSMAGVSDTQLQDHATRSFIYEFIQSHGGVDAVKEELIEKPVKQPGRVPPPAPPVPARCPAPPLPPAPPSRAPPPPPARSAPPPAPPAPRREPPPPRPSQPPSSAPPPVPPPPPPGSAPPPPPPPPPAPPAAPPGAAPPAAPPAPPPPPAPAPDAAPDPRALLFESIRNGNKNLKHVEIGSSRTSLNEDNRSNLLSEIRQGIELRSVSKTVGSSGSVGTNTGGRSSPCGLAGALARALQERSRVIHSSDSELSDETSDGEWDD